MQIVTVVSAVVAADRADEVIAAFQALAGEPLPDGLLRTHLLRGPEGEWRIESRWRDRAALDAMRAAPGEPAAPALFRRLGATPELRVLEVAGEHEGAQSPV